MRNLKKRDIVAEESFRALPVDERWRDPLYRRHPFGTCLRIANTEEAVVPAGKFIVEQVEGGIQAIPAAFNALMKPDGIQLRNCFSFERYVHPEGSKGMTLKYGYRLSELKKGKRDRGLRMWISFLLCKIWIVVDNW